MAFGIGGLTPVEFYSMTPAEFLPFIKARSEFVALQADLDNKRAGVICATFANCFRDAKKSKPFEASDFINTKKDDTPKKSNPERIYQKMKLWCSALGDT